MNERTDSDTGCCGGGAQPATATGDVRGAVQAAYGNLAQASRSDDSGGVAEALGYERSDIEAFGDANLGVGCGNPLGHAILRQGDRVLDLGSGAGFDALIARKAVGPSGHVIGVDMTVPMLERARTNAHQSGVAANVEFREGTIEALPVVSDSVDVVMSNCVVNLSPDKPSVFREAFRVLKPGGRLAVSDILLTDKLPPQIAQSMEALVGCVAGAAMVHDYERYLDEAGFIEISVERKAGGNCFSSYQDPVAQSLRNNLDAASLERALKSIGSYTVTATKPRD